MITIKSVQEEISRYKLFKGICIDQVLFESEYPILFSASIQNREYLFVCPLVNQNEIVWIATETTCGEIVSLLENELTIRDAFTREEHRKYMIRYDGTNVIGNEVLSKDIPDKFLPSAGEYMDAEDGEYDEEIEYYRAREGNIKIQIRPQIWITYPVAQRNLWIRTDGNFLPPPSPDISAGRHWTRKFSNVTKKARAEV